MPDVSALPKSARLRGDDDGSPDAEPIKTTSFHDQLRALRRGWERAGLIREHDDDEDAKLDADLQALAAEVRKHVPVLGTRGGLEERLWAALDRSVSLLERRLTSIEEDHVLEDAAGSANAVRNIAETMDRLGLLEPPPPPVEEMGALAAAMLSSS